MAQSAYKSESLFQHLLQSTKTVIPPHWKSSDPPSLEEWFAEVTQTQHMKELIAHTVPCLDFTLYNITDYISEFPSPF